MTSQWPLVLPTRRMRPCSFKVLIARSIVALETFVIWAMTGIVHCGVSLRICKIRRLTSFTSRFTPFTSRFSSFSPSEPAAGRIKTVLVYPPSATICGSGNFAFAHSSNINLMPRPHVSTVLREYITFAMVGFRGSLLFPTGRDDLRVGHLRRFGRDSARLSSACRTLSIMPRQHIHFTLIRPSVHIIDKPSTNRVVPHIFPFYRITVTFAELRVPAFALKQ